ncbi:LysE family translocator [Paucibacter sp. XJ19-41]|uniref:LysE family translocator n=1 Tax=Paucibacter sp. XJ19-41 TaxID=2927824 RepID=UPI00234BE150|nr:LysE family translocator [Paucibacter sp. XJ19-41]MDC6166825.1 LysE family translocator [Paucibacter sp. XJ19-41]
MSLSVLTLYLFACFVVTLTPGPTTLLALANGTTRNWRLAAMGIAGAALSDLVLIAAVALGLGALLAASETLFLALKWLGAFYLLWLAVQLWRSQPVALANRAAAPATAPRQAFVRSLTVALSNPKGLLFFSAFLPQFIDPAAPQLAQYLLLAATTIALDVLVLTLYAAGGAQVARYLSVHGMRWLNRLSAGTMLALAASLAAYRRADR